MAGQSRGRGAPGEGRASAPRRRNGGGPEARVDLQVKPKDTEPESFPMTHRCEGCGREVAFPEIFYTDNRCADCTDPYEVVRQIRRRKASMRVE